MEVFTSEQHFGSNKDNHSKYLSRYKLMYPPVGAGWGRIKCVDNTDRWERFKNWLAKLTSAVLLRSGQSSHQFY